MKIKFITILTILFFAGLGCNSDQKKSSSQPTPATRPNISKTEKIPGANKKPLIQIEQLISNQGYINILFNIVEQGRQDGYLVNKIQAMSKSDTLELIVHLKEDAPAGLADGKPEDRLLVDGIIFESTGPKSDRLLVALAQKYKINAEKLVMKSRQILTCANLNKTAVDYESGTPKFKIFLGDGSEVAELYVNFDFKKLTISLNEKDPQYREALINLLKE